MGYDDGSVNLPNPTSSGGGGGMDWAGLLGAGGGLVGSLGGLFGSQGSTVEQRRIAPPSMDELGLQGYLLNQIYNGGPNPAYAYGTSGIAGMLQNGMQASPQQLGYLDTIRQNTVDTGTRGINDWLEGAQRTNMNNSMARGMDQSSVQLWGQDQATKEAMRQVANLIGGAGSQYAANAVSLPYQTAGVYQNLATGGQNQQTIDMNSLFTMLQQLQAPRMAEVSQTTQQQPGSADTMGGIGNLMGSMGTLLPVLMAA